MIPSSQLERVFLAPIILLGLSFAAMPSAAQIAVNDPIHNPPPVPGTGLESVIESISKVVDLGAQNFTQVLEDQEKVLVMFYAPWCRHCQNMKHSYNMVSIAHTITVARVDCTQSENEPICATANVLSYPTLVLYTEDQVCRYESSERDFKFIIVWLNTADADRAGCAYKPAAWIRQLERAFPVITMLREDWNTVWEFKKGIISVVFGVGFTCGVLFLALLQRWFCGDYCGRGTRQAPPATKTKGE